MLYMVMINIIINMKQYQNSRMVLEYSAKTLLTDKPNEMELRVRLHDSTSGKMVVQKSDSSGDEASIGLGYIHY